MKHVFEKVGVDYDLNLASFIGHSTCNEECPDACSNKWEYREVGTRGEVWHVDVSINVSCGILCTVPLLFFNYLIHYLKIIFSKFKF